MFLKASSELKLLFNMRHIPQRMVVAFRISLLCGFGFVCPLAQAQTMWCPDDLNQDHEVSEADLAVIALEWGPAQPSAAADLDHSGQVDCGDVAYMLLAFGPCAPAITPNTAYALCEFVDTIDSPTPYPLATGWQIIWKPDVSTPSCFAMVFQATVPEFPGGEVVGLPMFAIAIQGTQNQFDAALDMSITPQVSFPPMSGARIGQGSSDALNCVLDLVQTTDGVTQSLQEWIESLSPENQLFVTGHSLGGNITSVLTPWIAYSVPAFGGSLSPLAYLPPNLCAMSFAAPTAGNLAFATFLNDNPIGYQAFFNSNDVVPNAWATTGELNLNRIGNLYASTGDAMPSAVNVLLQSKKLEMLQAGVAYTQTNGVIFTFPLGTPPVGTTEPWLWQVGYQHNNAYSEQFPE